jgi:hypothetical protein
MTNQKLKRKEKVETIVLGKQNYRDELNRRQFNNYTKRKRKLEKRMREMVEGPSGKFNPTAYDLMTCAHKVYERENERYQMNQEEVWKLTKTMFRAMDEEER